MAQIPLTNTVSLVKSNLGLLETNIRNISGDSSLPLTQNGLSILDITDVQSLGPNQLVTSGVIDAFILSLYNQYHQESREYNFLVAGPIFLVTFNQTHVLSSTFLNFISNQTSTY